MRRIFIFTLIALLVLTVGSWITSAVYGQTNETAGLNATTSNDDIRVTPAPLEDTPVINFFGNYIGSVKPGDLFYIDATSSQPDISINLYITNANELTQSLRYFILKVAIYVEDDDGQWQKVTSLNGITLPDTYITLENSPVNFALPGMSHYKITIESGSYKSYPSLNNDEILPSFYITADLI
jgi:hypothetical protein